MKLSVSVSMKSREKETIGKPLVTAVALPIPILCGRIIIQLPRLPRCTHTQTDLNLIK